MIEILTTGLLNSVQDLGRAGHLDAGVSYCGAMDREALETGNHLLGNDRNAAGIEVALFPFRLRFDRDTVFAVTGADCKATLDGAPLPPNWAIPAKSGATLVLSSPTIGARAYLTVLGGIDVPPVLGSRSTDQKGGFGGHLGRGLRRGDRLSIGAPGTKIGEWDEHGFGASSNDPSRSTKNDAIELRVLPAAEYDDFTPETLDLFAATDWQITPEANRAGYRLGGPVLHLRQPLELLSHGIAPGTIQVPPSGQPIIQLADANTCGGYPKIATVIEADLWRLAQAPVGSRLRFLEVGIDEAVSALRDRSEAMARLRLMADLVAKRSVADVKPA